MLTPDGYQVTVRCNASLGVTPDDALVAAVDALLGPGHVSLIGPKHRRRSTSQPHKPPATAAQRPEDAELATA